MEYQSTRDTIIALKAAKKDLEYTLPRIEEELLRRGKSVSPSTLKRVFKEGSEDNGAGFNVDHTLRPLVELLLEEEDRTVPEDAPPSIELELMRAELRVQVMRVEALEARNRLLEDRVTFLLSQIERKDRRIDEREDIIRKVMAERDDLRARLEALTGRAP